MTSIKFMLAIALGAAAMSAASARDAARQTPAPVRAVTVRYGDLDLSTERGAQALLARITKAAKSVCPQAVDRDLGAFLASRRCEREAIARAVRQVDSPRLAALVPARMRHG